MVRGSAISASSISFSIEEEQSANAETNHTTEVVGYYATTAGLIYASLEGVTGLDEAALFANGNIIV